MGRGLAHRWGAQIRSFLGPWPVQPAITAVAFFFLIVAVFIGVYASEVILPHTLIIPSLIASLVIFGSLKVVRKIQDRWGVSWWSVLLAVLLIWITLQVSRTVVDLDPAGDLGIFGFIPSFLRGFTASFIIITAIGYVSDRLRREANQAREALKVAREQQIQLIAADEAAKRQAALLLHDRVQAGLIASCLELQVFAQGLDETRQAKLVPIIDRLEHMRSIDVGSATRVLSPNLVDLDLTTALEELASQYSNVVDIVVDVDSNIDEQYGVIGENLLLGVYRIIEQAMLNAVKHGKPSHIWVSVVYEGESISVQVSDDGVGMSSEVVTGIGTTIITTWVRALEGDWRWERGPLSRGTTLLAVLPVASFVDDS